MIGATEVHRCSPLLHNILLQKLKPCNTQIQTGNSGSSALALLLSGTHCRITVDPPKFSALLSV